MRPAVLIIEPRHEVANAIGEIVECAQFKPIVRPYLEHLTDLGITPAVIILRISSDGISEPPYAVLERLPLSRPPVVAIAWGDEEVAEATRLKCDVVLRAPEEVHRLFEVLTRLVGV